MRCLQLCYYCRQAMKFSTTSIPSISRSQKQWMRRETRLLHNIPVIVQFSSVIHAERLSRMPWTLDYFQKKDGTGDSCCVSFPKSLIFRQKSELFFCKQPKHILMHLPPLAFIMTYTQTVHNLLAMYNVHRWKSGRWVGLFLDLWCWLFGGELHMRHMFFKKSTTFDSYT